MNRTLALALAWLAFAPARAAAQTPQVDSLIGSGQRLARAWASHDFAALTAGAGDILILLPGSAEASSLQARQAAALLRGFTAGTAEVTVQLVVARDVDRDRAYVEVQRIFTVEGTASRGAQTIYFGLRRFGDGYRLLEVRIVP